MDTLVSPPQVEVINLNRGNEVLASARPGCSVSGPGPVYTRALEVCYLGRARCDERHHDGVLENETHYDFVIFYVFIFYLTSIFIHGESDNKSSVSCWSRPISLSHPFSLSLSLSLSVTLVLSRPPSPLHLSLSVPHCQCREHSHSHRPLRGNTQQTRKMTASAISFSEGLQVRQEMAIIPSTLSVLSYFLL